MLRIPALLGVPLALVLVAVAISFQQPSNADAIQIEPVVWDFEEDYLPGMYSDTELPVQTVYLKTHDITDWMSRYDHSGRAVDGIPRLQALVREYNQLGIEVVAWFVPAYDPALDEQTNIDRQVQMATAVLDSGVKALYADVEPYDGFCYLDCAWTARNVWLNIRAQRPNAELGVIYDPRPEHWAQSDVGTWLSVADVALPMCYWESFVDQPPWNDPAGCVLAGYQMLPIAANNHPTEYVPMLQGDSTPEKLLQAVQQAEALGLERVSVWRRGVTPNAAWDAVRSHADPMQPLCVRTLADGCLLREESSPQVVVMNGEVQYPISTPEAFQRMGYNWANIQVAPNGFLASVASIPAEGTVLREDGSSQSYLVARGAKFPLPDGVSAAALGIPSTDPMIVPEGGLSRIPTAPADQTWLKELRTGTEWVVVAGTRFPITSPSARDYAIKAGFMSGDLRVVPEAGAQLIGTTPPDGSLFREAHDPQVYLMSHGARFAIPDPPALSALLQSGAATGTVNVVPPGSLAGFPFAPANGTLIRGMNDAAVYQVINGERYHVPDQFSLALLQMDGRGPVVVVPDMGVAAIPRGQLLDS